MVVAAIAPNDPHLEPDDISVTVADAHVTIRGQERGPRQHERDLLLGHSPAAFADQVVRLLQDDALARRLGDEGRRLVERQYGWAASAARLEALYRDLGAGAA